MASIKLKFRTSSVQEKEGRLYYQVIHNRVARQIHTEYRIYSSEWDADHSNIILPTSVTPQRQAYLLSLKDTLDADRKKLLLVIARLDKEGQSYTADTVVDNFHEGKELHGIIGYTLELNEKLRRIGKKRMVARYKTTLNSLQRYLKGGDVPLEEVDGTTIQGYEQWLKDSGLCRGKSSVRCPLKPKRFYPLKIFNNAPSKSLDRWGYYYFSLFPSVCRHLPDTFSV